MRYCYSIVSRLDSRPARSAVSNSASLGWHMLTRPFRTSHSSHQRLYSLRSYSSVQSSYFMPLLFIHLFIYLCCCMRCALM